MIKDLNSAQRQLEIFMSEISERCYSAGWLKNLEYVLWDATINGEKKYGQSTITSYDIEQLKVLSKACNSWIYFDEQTEETAINLTKWAIMYSRAIEIDPNIIHG